MILLALFLMTGAARAGIEAPISLGVIVLDARNIIVLEVEQFLPERALVVYKKMAELKGKHIGSRVRHGNIPVKPDPDGKWGRRGPSLESLHELLIPGRRAVFFHDGSSGVVYLGDGCWYTGAVASEDATANWGIWLPQYGYGFAGSVEQLERLVPDMLQGKEVIVPSLAATLAAGDQLYSMLLEPRRLSLPMWQIRAGTKIL